MRRLGITLIAGLVVILAAGPAVGRIWYVDCESPAVIPDGSSWEKAYRQIWPAVLRASPGDTIWVASYYGTCTYTETVTLNKALTLEGGYAGYQGQPNGNERLPYDHRTYVNSSGPCFDIKEHGGGSVVDGFWITGGSCGIRCNSVTTSTNITNNWIYGNSGVGVYCQEQASPCVKGNELWANGEGGIGCWNGSAPLITGNEIYENGDDGVYCNNSSPIIDQNTITSNVRHGVYSFQSSPTITNNVISGRRDSGCGICCYDYLARSPSCQIAGNSIRENGQDGIYSFFSGLGVTGNTISDNWGKGISCAYYSGALVVGNEIAGNLDGGVAYSFSGGTLSSNWIHGNEGGYGGGVLCSDSSPSVTNNAIWENMAAEAGGGIACIGLSSSCITNNTIVSNSVLFWEFGGPGGGIYCAGEGAPTIYNNIVAWNAAPKAGGGIDCDGPACPLLSHNDFWENMPDDYDDCPPGDGDISCPPEFEDGFHLSPGSCCLDAGENEAPCLPEFDFDGDDRIVDGDGDGLATVDIGADEYTGCVETEAPTYGDPPLQDGTLEGPLFGQPQGGYPGWVWFSIPLDPDECCDGGDCYDPAKLLGFDCSGKLWRWDKYGKFQQVWRPPFSDWDLSVGDSYLLYLTDPVGNPSYWGRPPEPSLEFKLGRLGWTWVGKPWLGELRGGGVESDFMTQVKVQYPVGGVTRTAAEDWLATPENWVQWGWPFYDTCGQCSKTFTPYAPFGLNVCYPWIGYRLWVNVGMADGPENPDQVTLIWP